MSDPERTADKTREVRGYRVVGRVQGVGFRWWTCREAERLCLVGSVRNDDDGSVAVLAAGAPEALELFEDALRRGPPLATVDRVERVEGALDAAVTEFRVER
jgi:acylphosphatase